MSDNLFGNDFNNHDCNKDAVCIDAFRIYDSCGDKDCLEDLKVLFSDSAQCIIDKASNVRMKDVEVICVYIDLEPVPFHKGFYSVNMTFFFDVELDVFTVPAAMPICVKGLTTFNKKVILYGSEGNVKIFCSDCNLDDPYSPCSPAKNLPKACVQVAKPIGLAAKLCQRCEPCIPCCRIPRDICDRYGGKLPCDKGEKDVFVTIGIFSIVQIERNVQMLIPAYDFCVPEKECKTSSDNPCEMFSRLDFPTDEFFPPRVNDATDDCGCK